MWQYKQLVRRRSCAERLATRIIHRRHVNVLGRNWALNGWWTASNHDATFGWWQTHKSSMRCSDRRWNITADGSSSVNQLPKQTLAPPSVHRRHGLRRCPLALLSLLGVVGLRTDVKVEVGREFTSAWLACNMFSCFCRMVFIRSKNSMLSSEILPRKRGKKKKNELMNRVFSFWILSRLASFYPTLGSLFWPSRVEDWMWANLGQSDFLLRSSHSCLESCRPFWIQLYFRACNVS